MKKNENDTEEKKLSENEETAEDKATTSAPEKEDDTEEKASEEKDTEDEAADKDSNDKDSNDEEDDEDGLDLPPIKRPERKHLSDEEIRSNKRILIMEVCVAAVALIIIIVAIVLKGKKDGDEGTTPDGSGISASENESVSADDAGQELVEIDNSALFVGMPPIPEQSLDELPDYDKLMAEKHILKLSTEDGGTVYVHDYTNSAYFKEQCTLDDDEVET